MKRFGLNFVAIFFVLAATAFSTSALSAVVMQELVGDIETTNEAQSGSCDGYGEGDLSTPARRRRGAERARRLVLVPHASSIAAFVPSISPERHSFRSAITPSLSVFPYTNPPLRS